MNPFLNKSAVLILIGVWLTTLIGIQSIPLEKHEVFVLQTAQEMHSSGELVFPHFNDKPRLQKPPFSYWSTLLISTLDPFHNDIQIWHGRLVSLLASLLMALVVFRAGTLFYGPETSLLAAILMLSMQGFIHLSHNARPDLLYAAFCTLQLFAWITAWKSTDKTNRQLWISLLGWLAFALATLTKGPQMPLVFLVGILIFLLSGSEKKRTLYILRPLSGIALFCIIVLPWWILLNQKLKASGIHIEESQMSGSLLHNLAGWKELLSGYYLWTLLAQMLPFSLIIPFVLPHLWKNRHEKNDVTRLLLTVGITMLIVFTLGGHYRKHYLLPVLPIASLFLANAIYNSPFRPIHRKWNIILFSIGSAGVLGCAGLLLAQGKYTSLALLSIIGYLLFILLKKQQNDPEWKTTPLTGQLLILSVLITASIAGYNALLPINPSRSAEQSMAQQIYQLIQPNDLLVQWKSSTEVLPYFAKRTVPSFKDPVDLNAFVLSNYKTGSLFAVLPANELAAFKKLFELKVLNETKASSRPSKNLIFVEILNVGSLKPM